MDPATVRTAIRHLQAVGLVEVYAPPGVGPMKAVTLRLDTPLGAALLDFYKQLCGQQGKTHSNSNET